ncbi:MAG: tRNA (adenosine(37)-N6)-threonylcarbamoyltransferase complex ATPase subunit type 1 TsaE [Alphaproteobacteria bacterium]
MPESHDTVLELDLADREATEALARRLADIARRGDVIGLTGELGAGKTTFARAFVRARQAPSGRVDREMPSPTFTLVQVYEADGGPVWHVDLYRLARPEDALELGIEEAYVQGIALIEWPERLGPALPGERLAVALSFGDSPGRRRARLVGRGGWAARLGALARRE